MEAFMAAAALTPRIRLMAICDGVRESRTEAGIPLESVRQEITAQGFPFLPRIWLFLLLSSPRPDVFPGYVRVVNDNNEKVIFYGHLEPTPKFESDDRLEAASIRINSSFPESGRYIVQVCFFQEKGSDVVKGELPFSVLEEGS